MKNHSRTGGKGRKGGAGYRTPSTFRFDAHQKGRDALAKNPFAKKR